MAFNDRALRLVLTTDILFQLFFWGFPGLIAGSELAALWEVPLPENPVYVRLLGAFSIASGVLLTRALRRPDSRHAILGVAVVSHLLVTGTILLTFLGEGVTGTFMNATRTNLFWWLTIILNVAFALGIFFALPAPEAE